MCRFRVRVWGPFPHRTPELIVSGLLPLFGPSKMRVTLLRCCPVLVFCMGNQEKGEKEKTKQISEFLAEVREMVGRNTCSVAGSARVEEMSLSIAGLSSSWCRVTDQG